MADGPQKAFGFLRTNRTTEHEAGALKEMGFPHINWLIRQHHRLFAERCTAHICQDGVRKHLRSEILRIIQQKLDSGLNLNLDPRFRLHVNEHDLEKGRLELILERFNGIRYFDDIRFPPGLEGKLVASHQLAGRHFQWKRLPPRSPVSIRMIDTTLGFGLFADTDLAEGDLIGEYAGMASPGNSIVDTTYSYRYPSLQIGEDEVLLSIDARMMGNETRFINHSRVEVVNHEDEFFNGHWHVLFTVSRPIARGEQLLINYGDGYWEGRPLPPLQL